MYKVRVYTDEEIKKLLSNPNVERVKNDIQIIYKNKFKLWAVHEKIVNSEKTARQIFEEAGFDMKILNEQTPQKRLNAWLKKYRQFGNEYFNDNNYTYSTKKSFSNDTNLLKKMKNKSSSICKDNSLVISFEVISEDE
ncbi:MAG: hypothetical protein IJ565_02605 [Bacilli bacterium]|nr:hypothetical protein [Bacilli bacterium]